MLGIFYQHYEAKKERWSTLKREKWSPGLESSSVLLHIINADSSVSVQHVVWRCGDVTSLPLQKPTFHQKTWVNVSLFPSIRSWLHLWMSFPQLASKVRKVQASVPQTSRWKSRHGYLIKHNLLYFSVLCGDDSQESKQDNHVPDTSVQNVFCHSVQNKKFTYSQRHLWRYRYVSECLNPSY